MARSIQHTLMVRHALCSGLQVYGECIWLDVYSYRIHIHRTGTRLLMMAGRLASPLSEHVLSSDGQGKVAGSNHLIDSMP